MLKKVSLSLCFFFVLLCLPFILQIAEAEQGTVIVDLRNTSEKSANRIFFFDSKGLEALKDCQNKDNCGKVKDGFDFLAAVTSLTEVSAELTNDEKKLTGDPLAAKIKEKQEKVKAIDDLLNALFTNEKLSQYATDRFLASKGDVIKIWIVFNGDKPEVNFEEIERDSQIMKDINVLIGIVKGLAAKKAEEQQIEPIKIMPVEYRLTKKRAALTIQVSTKKGSTDTNTDDAKSATKTTITTGPKEHLFLSTDVRFTKVSQLKYDSASKSLQEKDAPSSFYLGINYMLGDLLSKDQALYKNFVIKGLVKISKRPQDSFGFALGYRTPSLRIEDLDISLEAFSPFIGVVWTKEDSLNNGEVKTDKKYSKPSWVFGLSFNLDKAAAWVKKK